MNIPLLWLFLQLCSVNNVVVCSLQAKIAICGEHQLQVDTVKPTKWLTQLQQVFHYPRNLI